jgi:predicted transcriptional regulator YheO
MAYLDCGAARTQHTIELFGQKVQHAAINKAIVTSLGKSGVFAIRMSMASVKEFLVPSRKAMTFVSLRRSSNKTVR